MSWNGSADPAFQWEQHQRRVRSNPLPTLVYSLVKNPHYQPFCPFALLFFPPRPPPQRRPIMPKKTPTQGAFFDNFLVTFDNFESCRVNLGKEESRGSKHKRQIKSEICLFRFFFKKNPPRLDSRDLCWSVVLLRGV